MAKHRNGGRVRNVVRGTRVPKPKKLRPNIRPEPKADIPQGYILVPSSIALIIFRSLADFYLYTKTPLGGKDWSEFCELMHNFVNRRPDMVYSAWHEWSGTNDTTIKPTWKEHFKEWRKTHAKQ